MYFWNYFDKNQMFSTTCSLARFQSFNKINFDEHWPLFIISLNFKKALDLMICLIYYLCSIMMSHVPHIKYELKVFRNHIIIIRAHHWLHVAYYYQKEEGHFCLAPSVDRYLVQINSARPPCPPPWLQVDYCPCTYRIFDWCQMGENICGVIGIFYIQKGK